MKQGMKQGMKRARHCPCLGGTCIAYETSMKQAIEPHWFETGFEKGYETGYETGGVTSGTSHKHCGTLDKKKFPYRKTWSDEN